MEKKRKITLNERIESDPELKAILEESEDLLIERIKEGHREMREREARKQRETVEREAREQRRRERLRRFSFGLLGGD